MCILPENTKFSYIKDFAEAENKLLLQKDVYDSDLFKDINSRTISSPYIIPDDALVDIIFILITIVKF